MTKTVTGKEAINALFDGKVLTDEHSASYKIENNKLYATSSLLPTDDWEEFNALFALFLELDFQIVEDL